MLSKEAELDIYDTESLVEKLLIRKLIIFITIIQLLKD